MSDLSVELQGHALIVTIDREARRNALGRNTLREFAALRTRAETDEQVRAIVITGRGERAFCAGADLKERAEMTDEEVREQLRAYRTELGWLENSQRPVIAAINGAALGGGLELALLCDLRIAAPGAVLGLPETSLGIIPGAGGTQRLPRIIGSSLAKEMILLGRILTSKESLAVGLVHRIASAETPLLDQCIQWAEPILNGAPLAQAAALQAIDFANDHSLTEGLAYELSQYESCLTSQDRVEALVARKEKRPPRFSGR